MNLSIEEFRTKLEIGEDSDFEVKEADIGFPKSFWQTYSAFANTQGGLVVFGIKEPKKNKFEIVGLNNPEARRKELWDSLQDREKVSANLLSNDDIKILELNEKKLLFVKIPQAPRKERPIYINGNPLKGAYKRGFESDYHCSSEETKQMLREAADDEFDAQILKHLDVAELDAETIRGYRQRFRDRNSDHPWIALDDKAFITKLGGWRYDPNTGEAGVTVAGLLMFGTNKAFSEFLPHFHLDYQERLSNDPNIRWTHRITFDGRWECNVFNFYTRVINRLTLDLSVPFKLDNELFREGETHVHKALREALVNSLIHTDYSATKGIVVVKAKQLFYFQNPGRLRLPLEQLYHGGISDCRNPILQKMFLLLGLGEKAGSGIGEILRAWREQEWCMPLIREKFNPEMTLTYLPTMSMIPEEILKNLGTLFGLEFRNATMLERQALILAHQFGQVSNVDIQRYCRDHPVEIGRALKGLVERGWFKQCNRGRGTFYTLPAPGERQAVTMQGLPSNEGGLPSNEGGLPSNEGGLPSEDKVIPKPLKPEEVEFISKIRSQKRISPHLIRSAIMALCSQKPQLIKDMAGDLKRSNQTIYVYVSQLLKEKRIGLLYPDQPNRPDQAYVAIKWVKENT